MTQPPSRRLSQVALVDDYDRGIDFYVRRLGFELLEDTDLGGGKRWVRVSPGRGGTELLLARASGPEQSSRVGNQTGGRVFLFLETDDLRRDHARWGAAGVEFTEEPREEAYGLVVVFRDCFGNRIDLIERRRG